MATTTPLTPAQVDQVIAYLSHTLRLGIDTYREVVRIAPALAHRQLPAAEEVTVLTHVRDMCTVTGGDLCTATRLVDDLVHHRRISEDDAARMRLPQPLLRALGESMASLAGTVEPTDIGTLPLVDITRVDRAASHPELAQFLAAHADVA